MTISHASTWHMWIVGFVWETVYPPIYFQIYYKLLCPILLKNTACWNHSWGLLLYQIMLQIKCCQIHTAQLNLISHLFVCLYTNITGPTDQSDSVSSVVWVSRETWNASHIKANLTHWGLLSQIRASSQNFENMFSAVFCHMVTSYGWLAVANRLTFVYVS